MLNGTNKDMSQATIAMEKLGKVKGVVCVHVQVIKHS